MRTEERYLAARFGPGWEAYRRQTGMLLPKMSPRLPKIERSFHLRRPWREIGTLLLLPAVPYGIAALVHYLDRRYELPNWFF